MNDNIQEAFALLKLRYGSHSEVARNIGISKDHYRALRNGRTPIPERTAEYIMLKAQKLAPPPANPAREAQA